MNPIESQSHDSWHDFKRDLLPTLYRGDALEPGRYIFRGQANADWPLRTSFDRRFSHVTSDARLRLWDDLLDAFRAKCIDHDVAESVTGDDSRLLALAQHYGLPTRLLDWTTSPYVAAFFAFDAAIAEGQPGAEGHVAIWALDTTSPVWSKELGVEIVRVPAVQNERLRNQSGRFTITRTAHDTLESYVREFGGNETCLTRFVLPAAEGWTAIPDLDLMGINAGQLFPGISGLAQTVLTDLLLSSPRGRSH
jgi:hypothetical protein